MMGTTPVAKRPTAPIFDLFNLDQLVMLTGYSRVYLNDLRIGKQRIRPRFRVTVSRILGRPETELFGEAA